LDEIDTGKIKGGDGYMFKDNKDLHYNIAKGKLSDESEMVGTEFTTIEAPYIYYNAKEKYYYLFVNWGGCCAGVDSTYNIRVGRSRDVKGPYLDKNDEKMLDAGGSVFIPRKQKKNKRIIGPGHAGIFKGGLKNNKKDYFSFHFYDAENEGMGTLGVYEMRWRNGWPRVNLKRPMIPSKLPKDDTCEE
jgi:arabinan endo-1,5-alpha-L-arabinosidase